MPQMVYKTIFIYTYIYVYTHINICPVYVPVCAYLTISYLAAASVHTVFRARACVCACVCVCVCGRISSKPAGRSLSVRMYNDSFRPRSTVYGGVTFHQQPWQELFVLLSVNTDQKQEKNIIREQT